jgi:hypothetical protein
MVCHMGSYKRIYPEQPSRWGAERVWTGGRMVGRCIYWGSGWSIQANAFNWYICMTLGHRIAKRNHPSHTGDTWLPGQGCSQTEGELRHQENRKF